MDIQAQNGPVQVNFVQQTVTSSFQGASKRLRVTFSLSSRLRKALALSKKKFFLMTSQHCGFAELFLWDGKFGKKGHSLVNSTNYGPRSNLQTKTVNDPPHMLLSLDNPTTYPIVWRNRGAHIFPGNPPLPCGVLLLQVLWQLTSKRTTFELWNAGLKSPGCPIEGVPL